MIDRALILLGVAAIALVIFGLYSIYRRRGGRRPERLDVDELGLELMTGCCAFVLFTTPACRPCKAARRVIEDASGRTDGMVEVTAVDALQRSDLAARYNVRTIPTVFLITASGHVIDRWSGVPAPDAVAEATSALATAAAGGPLRRVRASASRAVSLPRPRG